jgi:hypothetical protein
MQLCRFFNDTVLTADVNMVQRESNTVLPANNRRTAVSAYYFTE